MNESGIDDLIIAAAPSWETASNDETERLRRANVDLELQIVLIPGTSDSPRGGAVYPGALYRAVSSSLGAVVAEWIATAADTRWTIGADFVRTVTGATAALHEGEIAFYGPKGLDDNAVVIDQTISHLGTIPGFPSKVGAVRVGPRTAAEITTSGSSAGDGFGHDRSRHPRWNAARGGLVLLVPCRASGRSRRVRNLTPSRSGPGL